MATPEPTAPSTPNSPSASPTGAAQTLANLPKAEPIGAEIALVPMTPRQGAPGIYAVSTVGGERPQRLATPAGTPTNPMMQTDRSTIMYLQDGVLRVMASDGSNDAPLWKRLPSRCRQVMHASWNRSDPTTLLVSCQATATTGTLMLVDLNGTVLRTLLTRPRIGDFSVSPDGATVIFWASDRVTAIGGPLYTMPISGTAKPVRLTPTASVLAHPVWSPDGTAVSFSSRVKASGTVKANWDVYTMSPIPGAAWDALAIGATNDLKAVWSPDGRQHLLISNRVSAKGKPGTRYDLWLIDRNGTVDGRLDLDATRITRPFWALR